MEICRAADAAAATEHAEVAAIQPTGFALFDLIAGSVDLDPGWQARVQGVTSNIARVTQQEVAKRSRIISQSNADISRIIIEGYEQRSRSQERTAEIFSNSIRGREIYTDRRTGEQFSLPNNYAHTWRLNDGSFVPTYSP